MGQRRFVAGILAGTALALMPQLAAAQNVRDLDQESSNVRSFAGTVTGDPAVFEASVPARSALRIEAITTSDLDPMIRVLDVASGELLAEDDDSAGDLNSRVTIRGEDGLRVRIEVSSFGYDGMEGEQGGSFDLRLTMMEASMQGTRTIGWGGAMGGTLIGGDKHEFTFAGEAGQVLDVVLLAGEGSGLDPYLELRDVFGEVIASNDDGGDGLNARLRHAMQSDGPFTIVASAYGTGGGEYTLRMGERREVVVQAPLQVIGIGDRTEGRLGLGYDNGDVDPAYIEYQLSEEAIAAVLAGEGGVTFRMNATEESDPEFTSALDPFLELGFDTPLGFATVDSDDDGGGDLNAMLPVDLADLATSRDLLTRLRIRAKSYSGSGGGYELRVTEGMEMRAAESEIQPLDEPVFD